MWIQDVIDGKKVVIFNFEQQYGSFVYRIQDGYKDNELLDVFEGLNIWNEDQGILCLRVVFFFKGKFGKENLRGRKLIV